MGFSFSGSGSFLTPGTKEGGWSNPGGWLVGKATGMVHNWKEDLKNDSAIQEQEMTPEELKLLESQMAQYAEMENMAPIQLAQMGYKKDASGNINPLTDQEAKTILAPDQYAIYQAKQQEAQALASGTLPDYMKREMDAQNNQILGAANRKLGPGGYYTSTPGNEATRLTAQNSADTAMKNRTNQLGLLSGYYGLGSGISDQIAKPGTALLASGQSIAKNMIQPFHQWSNDARMKYSEGISKMGAQGMSSMGGFMGGIFGKCWVAREVYGEDNPKWLIFREWLASSAPKWFLNLYVKYGERFAAFIRNKPILKSIIRIWMDSRIDNFLETMRRQYGWIN